METMLGVSSKDIFGTSIAGLNTIVASNHLETRSVIPSLFQRMRAEQGRSHAMVNLIHKSQGIVDSYQECSVTSFPIYQVVNKDLSDDEEEARLLALYGSVSRSSYLSPTSSGTSGGEGGGNRRSSSATTTQRASVSASAGGRACGGSYTDNESINYFGLLVHPLKASRNRFNL
jgi:hypothetical protein